MTSGRSHPRAFAPLALSHTALLTTFRRTGEAVSTPVSVALDDGRAYFMTAADSGKAKRLARDPTVTLAPCTVRGTVIGATVAGQAHPLEGEERRRARRLLRPMAPLWWSYLLYRLRGKTMRLYEVTPARTPTPKHSSSSKQTKQSHVPTSGGTPEIGTVAVIRCAEGLSGAACGVRRYSGMAGWSVLRRQHIGAWKHVVDTTNCGA
jgi:uncharacterized protein